MISKKLKKYFDGKRVSVITRSIRGTQELDGSVFTGNHVIEGYYIDEDQYYLFLCNEDGEVLEALVKRDIVRIFIQNQLDDGSPIPEEGELN